MELRVEVKAAHGEVKSGISSKTQKPYTLADQEVAVFVPGENYPTVMRAPVPVPDRGAEAGKPQWYKPGIYRARLKIGTGRFGEPDVQILFRSMVAEEPARKVA